MHAFLQMHMDYVGPALDAGPLPAFIYFALSAKDSLHLAPYCTPATLLARAPLRIFSFSLPSHTNSRVLGEEGLSPHHALQDWALQLHQSPLFLDTFFTQVVDALEELIAQGVIDPEHIGVGGLSRGAFIATHVAARMPQIRYLLGFAPLTRLSKLAEFAALKTPPPDYIARADLEHLAPQLLHLRHTRFYIGNRDTRTHTDACYHFIRTFAESAHQLHARQCHIDMVITSSIGHKGHGTSPAIFEEGTYWMKNLLLAG